MNKAFVNSIEYTPLFGSYVITYYNLTYIAPLLESILPNMMLILPLN